MKDTTGTDVETAFEAVDEVAEVRLSRKTLNRRPYFSLRGDAAAVETRKVELRSCVLAYGEPGEFKRVAPQPVFEAADEALILADRQARKRSRHAKKLRADKRKALRLEADIERARREADIENAQRDAEEERIEREARMLCYALPVIGTSETSLQPLLTGTEEEMVRDTPVMPDTPVAHPETPPDGLDGPSWDFDAVPDEVLIKNLFRSGAMICRTGMAYEGWSHMSERSG